ncbi:MAG: DUF4177 domain-containing protein [Sedimentitalea sp.]
MGVYEYKVVPAPVRGVKAKGVKTPEARFALSVEGVLNQMGAEGWEYVRAELLPSEERAGLTGSSTQWRNVLVFRRSIVAQDEVVSAPSGDVVALSVVAASQSSEALAEETRVEPAAPAAIAQDVDSPPAPAAVAQDAGAPEFSFRRRDTAPDESDSDTPRTPPVV